LEIHDADIKEEGKNVKFLPIKDVENIGMIRFVTMDGVPTLIGAD